MPRFTRNELVGFHAVFDTETKYDVFVSFSEQAAKGVEEELNLGGELEDVLAKYDTEGYPEAARLVATGEAVLPN